MANDAWPPIPFAAWRDTCATVHMWTQIIGKIRMALTPPVNHWWHSTLYVSACGLTTSAIPCGSRTIEIAFDFLRHHLVLTCSDGAFAEMDLRAEPVADFYRRLTALLAENGVEARIWPVPCEVPEPIPFAQDQEHHSYDPAAMHRFWQALTQADRIFKQFRAAYLGKVSPVHFFWGAFDLAVTRFSGRRAPEHPGAPGLPLAVVREAYSHECSSAGFWPGGGGVEDASFYAYAYPEPPGFRDRKLRSAGGYYHPELREFVLPYEAVRQAADPDRALLDFLEDTYAAAAERGGWDRAALERQSRT